jgi:hypothetical protein
MGWRYGILTAVFIALLGFYPQFYLIYHRGENYNGATAYIDYDEQGYAAYLQALIDGRPRKNDVYSGTGSQQAGETLYSIQVFPAYAAAVPARLFGISAEKAFLFILGFSAFFSAIALFRLMAKVTGNSSYAAVGTLLVFAFGAAAAGNGFLKEISGLGTATVSLPFLRRYTPAVAFPFFFLLFGFVWNAVKNESRKFRIGESILISACFAILVYSYFYLWTAAAAWLLLFIFFSLLTDFDRWKNLLLKLWLPTLSLIIIFITPYLWLLLQRRDSMDNLEGLERTRKIALFRPSILIAFFIISAAIFLVKTHRLKIKDDFTIFTLTFALLPLVLFNQQILTGYSLQPFHYNLYIANYSVLLAAVFLFFIIWQGISYKGKIAGFFLWLLLGLWGIAETHFATEYRYYFNFQRDEALPVNKRLAEIGYEDLNATTSQITLNSDLLQADNQPTVAPQGVLWAEHLMPASHLSHAELRRRYFLWLYYFDKDEEWLRESLQNCPYSPSCKPFFAWRFNHTLSINSHLPTDREFEEVIDEYRTFRENFSRREAVNPQLSFLIATQDSPVNHENLNSWYFLSEPEQHGKFLIYRLHPRENDPITR